METQNDKGHVGIVLGKIIPAANTLIYSLHIDTEGRCSTRISQRSRYAETFDEVCHLGQCLGDLVYGIWRNGSELPWYFIQLQEHWGAAVLHPFNIPITARVGEWTLVRPE